MPYPVLPPEPPPLIYTQPLNAQPVHVAANLGDNTPESSSKPAPPGTANATTESAPLTTAVVSSGESVFYKLPPTPSENRDSQPRSDRLGPPLERSWPLDQVTEPSSDSGIEPQFTLKLENVNASELRNHRSAETQPELRRESPQRPLATELPSTPSATTGELPSRQRATSDAATDSGITSDTAAVSIPVPSADPVLHPQGNSLLPPDPASDTAATSAKPVEANTPFLSAEENHSPATPPGESVPIQVPTPGEQPPSRGTAETETPPTPEKPPEGTPAAPQPPPLPDDIIEVKADRQEFDQQRQIVTAVGNVLIRVRQAVIDADSVQLNLTTRQMVAEGNVALTRGQQVIRGQRMEYNSVLNTGTVDAARGEVYLATTGTDFSPATSTDVTTGAVLADPISDRIRANQPLRQVRQGGPGATIEVKVGARGSTLPQQSGTINRYRFEAEKLNITSDGGWDATNVRLTNDPFSPPELELRADKAQFRRLSPLQDELITNNPRLVFDQGFTVPLLRERTVIDRRQREPSPFEIGYDRKDRGGLFIQKTFEPFTSGPVQLTLTPQFYIQRAFGGNDDHAPFNPNLYGLKAEIRATLSPTTRLDGRLNILTFDNFPDIGERNFRGGVRVQQLIGDHTLTGEYSYRDRLFNGTLGYQTVHSSVGLVLTSPIYLFQPSRTELTYQAGYQFINAKTDRLDLLDLNLFEPIPTDTERGRADLGRFQALVTVRQPIRLWTGEALPATATEGLKYTATPVIPFLQLVFVARGATSLYSNDDSQSYVSGSVGLAGQFGHFSKDFLDYTGFNIAFTQVARDGASPYYFDRVVDTKVLSFGLVQQIYGGIRAGFQSGINLETGEVTDNEFILEYSRRTYGILFRYSSRRQVGSLTFRITDFNWSGGTDPFFGSGVRSVEGGVRQ